VRDFLKGAQSDMLSFLTPSTYFPDVRCHVSTGGVEAVEAGKRWGEVAVAIRIARNSASTHMVNRLREVYREYLEKYAQAVEQVFHLTCLLCCQSLFCHLSKHKMVFAAQALSFKLWN
jgi:hypothetical protein